jgi:3-oxoacyl-[acyl-carrier protein] reductase
MTDRSDAHTAVTSLAGKRVIVTGGTTGIGRAIAVLLASEGARVHVCGRTPQHLEDALERINEVGEGGGAAIDLAESDNVGRYFDEATKWLGGLDIAIMNAAVPAKGLTDTSAADLRYQIAADFTAYLLCTHAAIDVMKGRRGDIILTGSMSTHVLGPGSTIYAGIKAGITGFAEALRKELGDEDIKVGLIEPGLTQADFHYPDKDAEAQKKQVEEETMLRSEDIAVAVHFMLTQPRRSTIQKMTVVPRRSEGE